MTFLFVLTSFISSLTSAPALGADSQAWDEIDQEKITAFQSSKSWIGFYRHNIELFSSNRGHFASIRSNHRRASISYEFRLPGSVPANRTVNQMESTDVRTIEELGKDPAFVERFGFPRLASVIAIGDSVYSLVWTVPEEPQGVSLAHADRFAGPWLPKFQFSVAVLMRLGASPKAIKIYQLPQSVEKLGGFSADLNLQKAISEYAYFELRTGDTECSGVLQF